MGSYGSKFLQASNNIVSSVYGNRKRKLVEEDDIELDTEFIEKTLHTPKRRKLLTTTQYIYKTLFLEEKASDVTVLMLGKAWKLHKLYISQSPYFASMFSGSWRETNEKVVSVEISDPRITPDSLFVVLGSFYQDEIVLEPKDVISTLATATLFQLQSLIDQCTEIMVETANIKTVIKYYNAAISYGVPKVKTACQRWLEVNLMGFGWQDPMFLKEISPELMAELIESPNLVVMQTEFCIYMILRMWLWVHLRKDESINENEFYMTQTWTEPFLETKEGKEYSSPFKSLRKKYLLLNDGNIKIMQSDNLIPDDWLKEAYKEQWLHILRIDSNKDSGPKFMEEDEFSKECFRCARCISKPGEHEWKWVAFHFGLDLIVSLDETTLRFRRSYRTESSHIKANHSKHHLIIKVCLISLNEQRQIKHFQDSGQLHLLLHKNQEREIMTLDEGLTYPLYISVNLQVVTPLKSRDKDKSNVYVQK